MKGRAINTGLQMNAHDLYCLATAFRRVDDPRWKVHRLIGAGSALGGNQLEIYEIRTDIGSLSIGRYLPSPNKTGKVVSGHHYFAVMPNAWVYCAADNLCYYEDGLQRLSAALNELRLQDDIVDEAEQHGVYNKDGEHWYIAGQRVSALEHCSWIACLDEDNAADVNTAYSAFNAEILMPEEQKLRELAMAANSKSHANQIINFCATADTGRQKQIARAPRRAL